MKPTSILTLLFVLGLYGCEEAEPKKEPGPSGVDLSAIDRAVDPCEDFYEYACGGWIDRHPLQPDAGGYYNFYQPFYDSLPRFQKIIESDAKGARALDDPHAALIGEYYSSCFLAPTTTAPRNHVLKNLEQIDGVTSLDDLLRQTAAQRFLGSIAFFYVGVSTDAGNPTQSIAYLDQSGVELPDRSYYLDADAAELRSSYLSHIKRMSTLIGGTPIDSEAALRVETALATAFVPRDERRDPASTYHPMKRADVLALAPNIPLQSYLDASGFGDVDAFNVPSPEYFKAIDEVISTTPIDDLKAYLRWQLLQDHARMLDQSFLDEDFSFWRAFTGETQQDPRWFTCLYATLTALGDAVAVPFVARFYDESRSAVTEAMFERTKNAFAHRLDEAAWLDASTREAAQEKLAAMVPKIGHPEQGPDYSGLTLAHDDYLDNVIRLGQFRREKSHSSLGQPVDRKQWNLFATTINATYAPSVNDVTVTAAILSTPFLLSEGSSAANFGALGSLLGHEMSHGFDDQGRHFDAMGKLRDWWADGVEKQYNERAQCIVDQYDTYEPVAGEFIDGDLTLGENIADLGGLRVAFSARFDGSEGEPEADGFTARQIFFLAYAQTKCENVRNSVTSNALLTDPHSPGKFRVNGPLSNLSEFQRAFACSAGDKMVRQNSCSLW